MGESSARHALAQAAFFEEGFLELPELLVEEVIRLVDKADEDVGDYRSGSRFDIGPIGLIGPIFLAAQPADESRFFAVLVQSSWFLTRRKSR